MECAAANVYERTYMILIQLMTGLFNSWQDEKCMQQFCLTMFAKQNYVEAKIQFFFFG